MNDNTTITTTNIKVTWKAFGDHPLENQYITSASFDLVSEGTTVDPINICNQIFRDTNLYQGKMWDAIEPKLSPSRTHTSLSVGDEVEIDGTTFLCEGSGWSWSKI